MFLKKASSILVVLFFLLTISISPQQQASACTTAIYDIPVMESLHPYENDLDKVYTVYNNSGLNAARLHFGQIILEDNVDYIEILDGTDVPIQCIETSHPDGFWTDIVPGTVIKVRLKTDGSGRYHLSDAYFRFFFRFLAPYHDTLEFDLERVLAQVKEGLRAFVGQTAFEELCRQWVIHQGRAGMLPFEPEVVGSHWDARVQADVVAVNWHAKQVLVGECKWGAEGIDKSIARELLEQKMPKVLASLPEGGKGWQGYAAIFARGGVKPAAQAELQKHGGLVVQLEQIDRAL